MTMDPKNSKPESEDAPYSAFSPKQRTMILTVVCIAGLTSPLSSLMYTPALPAIANSLGVSISDINLTVTIYLIFQGEVLMNLVRIYLFYFTRNHPFDLGVHRRCLWSSSCLCHYLAHHSWGKYWPLPYRILCGSACSTCSACHRLLVY